MNEIFPIVAGGVLGALIGGLKPSIRLWVGVPLAIVLGIAATVISGEFKTSWGYLFIDIPLVSISALGFFLVMRRLRWDLAG